MPKSNCNGTTIHVAQVLKGAFTLLFYNNREKDFTQSFFMFIPLYLFCTFA